MNNVVHFEYGLVDPERGKEFYEKTFGWKLKKWEGGEDDYWMLEAPKDMMGIGGGFYRREGMVEQGDDMRMANNAVVSIGVDDVDEMLEKVKMNGGMVIQEKMEVTDMGWSAYCKDTEGNIFGLFQATEEMKKMGEEMRKKMKDEWKDEEEMGDGSSEY